MDKKTQFVTLGRPHGKPVAPVNPPISRASTFLFERMEDYQEAGRNKYDVLRYGRHGTETTFALAEALAEIEGGHRAALVPSGLASIASALLAFAQPGGHVLVVDNCYGPTRHFCETRLKPMGMAIEYFSPGIGAAISGLITDRTVAVFCESPGSCTFEMQDIPTISAAAHARDVPVLHDNTWGTPYFFNSFEKGVDVSIHAVTKYIGGHSDLMMGAVVCNERTWLPVRQVIADHGYSVSADDAYLALRGLRTLGVRLDRHYASALEIARWLEAHPHVGRVLYPALPSDPGHALWARDFSGASGLLGFTLAPYPVPALHAMVESLNHFGIGSSWGGYESLMTLPSVTRTHPDISDNEVLVRIHVGLDAVGDLIADLDEGLAKLAVHFEGAPT